MAFGADRSVKVVLKAEVSDFIGKMTSASKATQGFGKDAVAQAAKHKQSFDMVGKGLLAGGAAIGAGLGLAVAKFADFDAAMSAAAAASGATGASLGALRDLAIKAGADTQYSATEAAQGITEMAKAGVSAKDIMGGGLTGALSLAAAGQMDVGDAAEAAASAMNQFGLKGSQMGHIADDLSNGANAAQGSVADMSQALNQTGVVASSFGMSLDDTVTTLTMFAKAGMTGSDAGTSMKTMIQRLAAPTDEAKGLMDQLGLSVYDATGKFVGMSDFSGQLKTSLAGYSDEAKNSALATIFGADAVRGATIAAKNGAEGFDALRTQVTKVGGASEQAAALTNNLKGDIERLGGSIDTALIQGGSVANGALRSLTQGLTGVVNGIGSMGAAGTQAAVGLAAATTGVALLGGGALVMLPKIAEAQKAMVALGLTAGRTGTALKIAGGAFAIFAVAAGSQALGSYIGQSQVATVSTKGLATALGGLGTNAKNTDFTKMFGGRNGFFGISGEIDTTTEALKRFGVEAFNALDQGWNAKIGRLQDPFQGGQFAKQVTQIDKALADMVQSGNASGAAEALKHLTDAAAEQGVSVPKVAGQFTLYNQAVAAMKEAAAGAGTAVGGYTQAQFDALPATQQLALSEEDLAKKAQAAKKAHDDLISSVENFGGVVLTARGAARDYQAALDGADAALKENGKTLSTNTAKGRANQVALETIATSALKVATANIENKKSLSSVTTAVMGARTQFIDFAHKMGMSIPKAKALADQLGLTKGNVNELKAAQDKLPASKMTKIGTPGSKESTDSVNTLHEKIRVLQGKVVKVLASGAGDSAGQVAMLRAEIARLAGKTVTITTVSRRVVGTDSGDVVGHGSRHATGGAISGPGTGTSDDIPAWLSNGEHVLTAEDVKRAGGHEAIYAWRKSLGSSVKRFARGGAVGFASGGEVDFSGIMAIIQAGAFSYDDLKSARSKPGQVKADIKAAQASLAKLLASQAKNQRDLHAAQQRLTTLLHTKKASKTSITSARNRVADELAEQHKLLGQVASAEGKVTSTRKSLAAATDAAAAASVKYARANRPLITRTIEAAGSRNSVTAKFLANIKILMSRGFTSLARNLMNQGGPEAETLAAQAVKSTAAAKSLQSRLNTSASLDAQAQALEDKLNGVNQPAPKPKPKPGVTLKPGESVTVDGQKFTGAADRRYTPMPQPSRYVGAPTSVTNTSTVFNAHGSDADTALAKAMRDWEFKQVTRL